jgi:phenylalanyl-tRNA synthetase alpha chain
VSADTSVSGIEDLVKEAMREIANSTDLRQVDSCRVRLVGKKGLLTEHLKRVGHLPVEERRTFGQKVNDAKQLLAGKISERIAELEQKQQEETLQSIQLDISLPGRQTGTGSLHPVTRTIRRINEIFLRIGFAVAEGPEIENEYYNFEALNIPADHPARAMHDTFYVGSATVLRTHTSPVQIRYLESHEPPLQVIAPGRVFRCDSDVTHTPMFHQLEGLAVDTDITFSDLKGILIHFLQEFFEQDFPVRFRPAFFPFTEPSAEVDMGCVFCQEGGCRICKQTGWLEILGCGMVHPEVFRHVGIDNEKYTGYAFGVGIERLAMLRYGVDDLRLFFDNELGFLNQFQ